MRIVTALLFSVLLLAPAFTYAQYDAPQIVRSYDLVTPPGAAVSGVAHIEDVKKGTKREIHIVVTTNSGSGELVFDGRAMVFGDGYTIVRETLVDNVGEQVLRLTGTAPDGASERAIIAINRQTGHTASEGIETFSQLVSLSADERLIGSVLPLVVTMPGVGTGPAPMVSAGDCLVATVIFAGASTMLIANCSSGNLLGCTGSALLTGAATSNMASSCPDNGAGDGTIGWG